MIKLYSQVQHENNENNLTTPNLSKNNQNIFSEFNKESSTSKKCCKVPSEELKALSDPVLYFTP